MLINYVMLDFLFNWPFLLEVSSCLVPYSGGLFKIIISSPFLHWSSNWVEDTRAFQSVMPCMHLLDGLPVV